MICSVEPREGGIQVPDARSLLHSYPSLSGECRHLLRLQRHHEGRRYGYQGQYKLFPGLSGLSLAHLYIQTGLSLVERLS